MMATCTACSWEPLTTVYATGEVVQWRRVVWACPDHDGVVVPAREVVLELPPEESPLLDGPPVEGVVVEVAP